MDVSVAVAVLASPPASGVNESSFEVPGLHVSHRTTAEVRSARRDHGPLLTPLPSQERPASTPAAGEGVGFGVLPSPQAALVRDAAKRRRHLRERKAVGEERVCMGRMYRSRQYSGDASASSVPPLLARNPRSPLALR